MVSKILGPFIPGIFNLLAPKMINEKANQFLWLTQGVSTTACADPGMLSMVSTHHRGGRCWYNRSPGLHAGQIRIRVMRQKVLEGGESELRCGKVGIINENVFSWHRGCEVEALPPAPKHELTSKRL